MAAWMFSSCGENSKDPLSGADNPLSQWSLPVAVHAGGEGVIQWNGFTDEASLILESTAGAEYQLDVIVVTASGLSFKVPADIPEGGYMLVLIQEARTELGVVEVLPGLIPVDAVKVPSGAVQGEEVVIEGLGFDPGCVIVLVNETAGEFQMDTGLVSAGVMFTVPDDMPEADYRVFLVQDDVRWLLSTSFKVAASIVVKSLKAVRLYSPYIGDTEVMYEWEIDEEAMTLSEYIVEGGSAELNVFDRYVLRGNGYFALSEDGFESSNNMEMSYTRDGDGKVTRADVLRYGKNETTPFDWTYSSDGYLTEIVQSSKAFRSMEYDGDKMTEFRQIFFEYPDDPLLNHSCAYDVIWGYMSLLDTTEPFVYFPYLLGWYSPSSEHLPSKMFKPSPTGQGTVECILNYDFDQDGYVISMSWAESSRIHRVEYEYSQPL